MIELDAKTNAKTVNASANCAPGFLLIVTCGAGTATDDISSPIRCDEC